MTQIVAEWKAMTAKLKEIMLNGVKQKRQVEKICQEERPKVANSQKKHKDTQVSGYVGQFDTKVDLALELKRCQKKAKKDAAKGLAAKENAAEAAGDSTEGVVGTNVSLPHPTLGINLERSNTRKRSHRRSIRTPRPPQMTTTTAFVLLKDTICPEDAIRKHIRVVRASHRISSRWLAA